VQWRVVTHQFSCFVNYIIATAIVYHDFNEYKNAGTVVEVTDLKKFAYWRKRNAKETVCL